MFWAKFICLFPTCLIGWNDAFAKIFNQKFNFPATNLVWLSFNSITQNSRLWWHFTFDHLETVLRLSLYIQCVLQELHLLISLMVFPTCTVHTLWVWKDECKLLAHWGIKGTRKEFHFFSPVSVIYNKPCVGFKLENHIISVFVGLYLMGEQKHFSPSQRTIHKGVISLFSCHLPLNHGLSFWWKTSPLTVHLLAHYVPNMFDLERLNYFKLGKSIAIFKT